MLVDLAPNASDTVVGQFVYGEYDGLIRVLKLDESEGRHEIDLETTSADCGASSNGNAQCANSNADLADRFQCYPDGSCDSDTYQLDYTCPYGAGCAVNVPF